MTTEVLTVEQVDQLESETRAQLSGAIANLTRLREGGAHSLRGFPSWHAYVLDRFGDLLRELHLPKSERLPLVDSMQQAGMTVRETADKLSVAKSQVGRDRAELARVHRLDDHRPAAPTQDSSQDPGKPAAPAPRTARILAVLAAATGPLTVVQICKRSRMPREVVAPALTRLARPVGSSTAGRVVYTRPAKRGQFGTYALAVEVAAVSA
jgi:hypothetical protein